MFSTPPKMLTRRRAQEQREETSIKSDEQSRRFATPASTTTGVAPGTSKMTQSGPIGDQSCDLKVTKLHNSTKSSPPYLSLDTKQTVTKLQPPSRPPSQTSARTKRSSAASIARHNQLKQKLADALTLIKRLEAKIENDEQSERRSVTTCHSEQDAHNQSNVEQWLDRSHQDVADPLVAPKENQEILEQENVNVPSHQDSMMYLANTLRDLMTQQNSQKEEKLLSRLATPRDLPAFAGDCIEWLHFKNAYEESTRVCRFTENENLWRLRHSLRGEAREAVGDLLIGNTPPDVILGRSDLIIHNVTAQLRKLPPLSLEYKNEIINFSMKINNCVATIRALKQNDCLRSPELAAALLSKLPSTLAGKYTDFAYERLQKGESKLELLAEFLKKESKMISVVGLIQPYEYKHRPKQVFVTTTAAEADDRRCNYCRKGQHTLQDCRLFKRALKRDRWRFVKDNKLCFCCLKARHDNNICPEAACAVDDCGMNHHRLLHYNAPSPQLPSPSQRDPPEVHPAESSSTVAHVTSSCDVTRRSTDCVMLKVVPVQVQGPSGVVNTYALLDDAASVSMIDSELVQQLGIVNTVSDPIKLINAFGLEVYQSEAPRINLNIKGHFCKQRYDVTLRSVSKLNLPVQDLSCIDDLNVDHFISIKNRVCKGRVVPRLLIGEDNYFLIAPLQVLHGGRSEPYASHCRLGWSIHGYYSASNQTPHKSQVVEGVPAYIAATTEVERRDQRTRGYNLGRNARMLAAQSIDRVVNDRQLPAKSLLDRAMLQVIINKYLPNTTLSDGKLKRISKCDTFEEYYKMADTILNLNLTDSFPPKFFIDTELHLNSQWKKMILFYLVRLCLAQVIESVILLDRTLFLYENGFNKVYLIKLFDPVLSPRCHSIVCVR